MNIEEYQITIKLRFDKKKGKIAEFHLTEVTNANSKGYRHTL